MIQTPKIKIYTVSAARQVKKHSYSATVMLAVLLLIFPPIISNLYYYHTSFAASGNVSFAPAVNYATGNGPTFDLFSGPVPADFNKDGHLDLVTTNSTSNTVSIFLGHGDGIFSAKVDYGAGAHPMQAAVADFNGDTYPDIVVTDIGNNSSTYGFSVLINNGDGTFGATASTIVVRQPYGAPHITDFNKDGKLDIAFSDDDPSYPDTIYVVLGNGDGTFNSPINYSLNTHSPFDMAIADFNNDTYPDIVAPNCGGTNDKVSVLINNGDGTFGAAANYAVGDCAYIGVTTADFNKDGFLDIAVNNDGSNNISVLINQGNGTFANSVNYAAGSDPLNIDSADLNGDGYPDLLSENGAGTSSIGVFINNQDGTFAPMVTYQAGSGGIYSMPILPGDFNKDGNLDIITSDYGSNVISVLPGKADGTFGTKVDYNPGGSPQGRIGVGDFNEDGLLDFAVANYSSNNISVFINNTALPTVAFASASGSGLESVASPAIPVNLSEASDTDVTVHYAVTGGTATGGGVDYTLASGNLTIPAGETTASIPLSIVDNSTVEPDETVVITLSSPLSAFLGTNTAFTYTITNDDHTAGGGSGGGGSSTPPDSGQNGGQTPPPGLQFPPDYVPPTDSGNNTGGGTTGSAGSDSPINKTTIKFTRNLRFGNKGVDVRDLQKFLNNNGITVATSGPGAPGQETTLFRDRTKQAVKSFQEKFAAQILAPLGLTQGTGFFGDATRNFVNSLLN